MTKQEYHNAISKAIAMGKACGVCQTSVGHELNKIKDEYIASLEAENAALKELHETWLGTYRIKLDYIDELENKLKRSSLL